MSPIELYKERWQAFAPTTPNFWEEENNVEIAYALEQEAFTISRATLIDIKKWESVPKNYFCLYDCYDFIRQAMVIKGNRLYHSFREECPHFFAQFSEEGSTPLKMKALFNAFGKLVSQLVDEKKRKEFGAKFHLSLLEDAYMPPRMKPV